MSEINTRISEKERVNQMSTTEFTQLALREYIAPPSFHGELAKTRTTSAWNACPKMKLWADELAQIEKMTGLSYARQEYQEINALISNADRLLDSTDPDFHSAFTDAFRAFIRSMARSRNSKG